MRTFKPQSATDYREAADLPRAWQYVRLADLAESCSGTTPSRGRTDFYGGRIPWVKTGELLDGEILDTEEHVTKQAVNETSLRLLPKGTVLVAMYGQGQTRGRTALLRCEATTNQACFAILPNERFEPEFIQFWFRFSYQRLRAMTEGRGGNQPNLNGQVLREEVVPVPALGEQRRIAAHLREQLAAVAQARVAVQAQLDAAQALPAAHLCAVFNGNAAKKWPQIPLIEASEISGGITLGRNLRGRSTRAVPYLRVANVKDGRLDLSLVKEAEATESEIEDCRLIFGDILLTEGGDPDKLGRGTYWQEQIPECIHQNHIFRVRFDLAAFNPAFVAFQMGSPSGKAYFLKHAKQTTGIASINKTVLSKFPLLIPPFAKQCMFASQLEAEKKEAATLTKTLTDKLTALDHLPAALLREAFGGCS